MNTEAKTRFLLQSPERKRIEFRKQTIPVLKSVRRLNQHLKIPLTCFYMYPSLLSLNSMWVIEMFWFDLAEIRMSLFFAF